jgi:hypothetical protein
LRGISFRWPGRKIAMNKVRVEKAELTSKGLPKKKPSVWYKCEHCGVLGKPAKNKAGHPRMWVDHKDPVVPLDRYPSWSEYVERLFCSPNNFEVLCDDCHYIKSQAERSERRRNLGWKKTNLAPPSVAVEPDSGEAE